MPLLTTFVGNVGYRPAVVTASINSTGLLLTITLNQASSYLGYALWPDGTVMQWPDGSYAQWPLGSGVTATADGVPITLTYSSGNGTNTWVYNITNGNPSGNPVLAGASVLLSAAAGVWQAGGVPSAAVVDAAVVNGSGIYNYANFVSASSQSLSIADNSTISMGDVSMFVAGIFDLGAKTTPRWFIGQGSSASPNWCWRVDYDNSPEAIRFAVSPNGTALTEAKILTSPTVSTRYFVCAYHDPVSNLIGVSLNGSAFTTTAHTTGILNSALDLTLGASSNADRYLTGKLSGWTLCKNIVGGFATTSPETMRNAIWNSGSPRRPSTFTTSEKTAWGAIAGWVDTSLTADVIGSNTLTNNGVVTLTTGTF